MILCAKSAEFFLFLKNLYLTGDTKPQRLFIPNHENMKKTIVLLLFFLGSTSLIFAQKTSPLPPTKSTPSRSSTPNNANNRVEEIRKWYSEIQAIGMKNCTTKTYTVYETVGYDDNGKQIKSPYEQTIQRCNLSPIYSLYDGYFTGDHWGQSVKVYLKNKKIFFVLIAGGGEGSSYEERYYCNEDEKIIKELSREADFGEELTGANIEVKTNINKDIRKVIDFTWFNRIQL